MLESAKEELGKEMQSTAGLEDDIPKYINSHIKDVLLKVLQRSNFLKKRKRPPSDHPKCTHHKLCIFLVQVSEAIPPIKDVAEGKGSMEDIIGDFKDYKDLMARTKNVCNMASEASGLIRKQVADIRKFGTKTKEKKETKKK